MRPFFHGGNMTAELHVTPSRATNSNGLNLDGAKWFFYLTGTSTPESVFTTADLNVAHANPVVADAAGKFASIYFDSSKQYRGVLKTSDESTTIYDIDPINTNVFSQLAASGGSALMGFIQSGTGSLARTVQDKLRDFMSIADKGTTADALAALQDAEADLNAGGALHIPKGTWTLSGTFTADGQRLNIKGDGQNVSLISFAPASADVAIEYNNVSSGGLYQGSIVGLGFTSGNTVDKTAIYLRNCADTEVSHIGIATGGWQGSGSIGLQTLGRQSLHFHNSEIACARPLVISQNPVFTSLNTDHYLIERCELTTTETTGKAIEFADGVMITTCCLRNLALTGGKYGIYWNDTTSVGSSYNLVIDQVRREQSADATGYSIYLATASRNMQNLTIKDCYLDQAQNGIYLRNCLRVTIQNTVFAMNAGETAIDMTFVAGSSLTMINCTFNAGATVTLTTARCVRREHVTGIGFVEEWVYDAGFSAGAISSDVYLGGVPFSLANTATAAIADNTFTGFILVSTSEDVSAIYCLSATTGTVSEISDPFGFFTNTVSTPSRYNIYWDAGTSRYRIENLRGVTATISVLRLGANV